MTLPADNKFVDSEGRIVESWRRVFERLDTLQAIATPAKVAAIIALLGATEEAEETGAIGDIQYRDATGFVNLPIGAIGSLLGVNEAGNAPEWGDSDSGFTALTHYDSGTLGAATVTIDNSVITKAYARLEIDLHAVSHDNASSRALQIELSDDNGTSFTAAQVISGSIALGALIRARIIIPNAAVTSGSRPILALTSDNAGTAPQFYSVPVSVTSGHVNCLRFSWNGAGNFDGFLYSLSGFK